MTDVDKTKEALSKPRLLRSSLQKSDFLSTGSTLLDLALTGRIEGGFIKGSYVLFVGDTDSGKTMITMTCLAEAAKNPSFDEYRFLFINKERGVLMDIESFFGKKVQDRLEWIYSENLEEMYFDLDDALKEGQPPFICVVDSIDSLSSEYEGKKFEEKKRASRLGTKAKGDFGDGKAAIHSRNIRRVLSGLERTGSIIVFINQSRDNIDAGFFAPAKTHSGGWAISFYATMKVWSSVAGQLTRVYKAKKRQLGIDAKVKIVRTRMTGRHSEVHIPIYHSVGMDDVGGCVQWLVEEGRWKKSGDGIILASDFDVDKKEEDLVQYIEDNDLEFDLRQLVLETWKKIEKACRIKRKRKYE